MNLSDFDKTEYSGLYISKAAHPTFGKKYIARFQYNKKRYVKVLGYTKKDNLTKKTALTLMQKFKDSIVVEKEEETVKTPITEKNFDKKEKTYLLGYFDYSLEEVVYRPIDRLLYHFLKTINKEENIKVNIRIFFRKNKIAYKDYAKSFEVVLEELFQQKVLV